MSKKFKQSNISWDGDTTAKAVRIAMEAVATAQRRWPSVMVKYISHNKDIFIGHKLSDEELEIVLTAHAAGDLVNRGRLWNPEDSNCKAGCVLQFIYNEPIPTRALRENPAVAVWFDQNYYHSWSAEKLIENLIEAGMY
jgi:hypothetical protein